MKLTSGHKRHIHKLVLILFLALSKEAAASSFETPDPFYLNFARTHTVCSKSKGEDSQSQCRSQYQTSMLQYPISQTQCDTIIQELSDDLIQYLQNGYQIHDTNLENLSAGETPTGLRKTKLRIQMQEGQIEKIKDLCQKRPEPESKNSAPLVDSSASRLIELVLNNNTKP